MSEIAIIAGICIGVLAAWFLVRIDLAEAFLIVMTSSAGALGVYWLWTGSWGTKIAEGVGMFALGVITLGSVRVGIEKLGEMLAAHSEACANALGSRPPHRRGSGPPAHE